MRVADAERRDVLDFDVGTPMDGDVAVPDVAMPSDATPLFDAGEIECESATDCPQVECLVRGCSRNQCVYSVTPAVVGTPCESDNECISEPTCQRDGACGGVADCADLPVDACEAAMCVGGDCIAVPVEEGLACPGNAPFTVGACTLGECEDIGCREGMFSDCDGDLSNGCESLRSDDDNCGFCGNRCEGESMCVDGACFFGCITGVTENCDGDIRNGCETRTIDNAGACGGCLTLCSPGQACVSGGCADG